MIHQESLNSLAHIDTQLDSSVVMFTALGQHLARCQEKSCLKERPKYGTGRRGHTVNEGQLTDLQFTLQAKVLSQPRALHQ